MRPNHQNNNKRMRGRNRGGGKGPNPLSRSYESNGPDVKIRGTAQHIAEKYLQLARDAQASGDPVAAESYWQHAEHYLRLIAAAQEQFRQQNPHYRPFEINDPDAEDADEDTTPYAGGPQPDVRFPQAAIESEAGDYQPRQFQPREPREPRERDFQPREGREPREFRSREPREPRGDYQPREGREFQPRQREPRDYQPREAREPREFQPRESREPQTDAQPREAREPRESRFPRRGPRQDRQERAAPEATETALPAFITAPVRSVTPAEMEPAPAPAAEPAVAPAPTADEAEFPVRPRRRRKAATPAVDEAPAGE